MQSAAINMLLLALKMHVVQDEWHPLVDIFIINTLLKHFIEWIPQLI